MARGAYCTRSVFCMNLVAALLLLRAAPARALSVLPEGGRAPLGAAAAQEVDCLVVVRTHRPMPGMLERFREHFEDLREHLPSARLVISADTSGPGGTDVLEQVRHHAPGASLHAYSWQDVVAGYPALARLQFASAWSFHTEPLLMAVDYSRRAFGLARDARVWVMEDDVFFCGGLSRFLSSYRGDASDLLGIEATPTDHWLHRQEGSAAFLQRYPADDRLAGPEVVQRFSMPLLDLLQHRAQEGVTAWSEMFAATVCKSEGFLCGQLRSEHVGIHGDKVTVNRSEAEAACRHRLGASVNHAAKF